MYAYTLVELQEAYVAHELESYIITFKFSYNLDHIRRRVKNDLPVRTISAPKPVGYPKICHGKINITTQYLKQVQTILIKDQN
jgi:hypothetical protein